MTRIVTGQQLVKGYRVHLRGSPNDLGVSITRPFHVLRKLPDGNYEVEEPDAHYDAVVLGAHTYDPLCSRCNP
jgi:predicted NAD/FAD-binding protein